jgi:hypothetical protein
MLTQTFCGGKKPTLYMNGRRIEYQTFSLGQFARLVPPAQLGTLFVVDDSTSCALTKAVIDGETHEIKEVRYHYTDESVDEIYLFR